ncbi:MAG: hypothetical protein ACOH5I_14340 [Oligoflexus sp.]
MHRIQTYFQAFTKHIGALLLVPPAELRQHEFFRRDLGFQLAYGAGQAIVTSLAFIIMKQVFDSPDTFVALVQSGVMAGLLSSLFYVNFMAKHRPNVAFVIPHSLGWIALLLSIFAQGATSFSWMMVAASFLFALASPFQGVIYGLRFGKKDRGRVVALLKQWQTLASVIVAWGIGSAMEWSTDAFRWLFLPVAIYGLWTCRQYSKIDIPVAEEKLKQRPQVFQSLACLKHDVNFAKFLFFQFILGLSNIAGVTVMQIYVNDQNFLNASPASAAWVTGVLPPLFMFLSIRIWGAVFDRISIVWYRALTSLAMAIGFAIYPLLGISGAMIGALIWGIGRGGGQLAWSIGILTFAGEKRSAEYLAVHTFLTGVRGVMAPFIGVWAIHSSLSPAQLFWTVSIIIATTALATVIWVANPEPKA